MKRGWGSCVVLSLLLDWDCHCLLSAQPGMRDDEGCLLAIAGHPLPPPQQLPQSILCKHILDHGLWSYFANQFRHCAKPEIKFCFYCSIAKVLTHSLPLCVCVYAETLQIILCHCTHFIVVSGIAWGVLEGWSTPGAIFLGGTTLPSWAVTGASWVHPAFLWICLWLGLCIECVCSHAMSPLPAHTWGAQYLPRVVATHAMPLIAVLNFHYNYCTVPCMWQEHQCLDWPCRHENRNVAKKVSLRSLSNAAQNILIAMG